MTDSLGRSWQLGTVQLDYNMPERFELTYTGADNAEHTPVMIHRALLGSMERFAGILIEHYSGRFPIWLGPAATTSGRRRSPSVCGPTGSVCESTSAPNRSARRSGTPSSPRPLTCW